MKAKFADRLNLKNNARTVDAWGPCNWEDGDQSAEISQVRITQNGVVAESSATVTVTKGRDRDWRLPAESTSGAQIPRGPAQAFAVARVRRTDNSTYDYPWPDDVTLN